MLQIIKEIDPHIQPSGQKSRKVLCKCICGVEKVFRLADVKNGHTKSCGCYKKTGQYNITHGLTGSRIYIIWYGMKARCNNKDNKNYGSKGITYDKKWEKFEGFYKDMKEGYSDKLTIDRIKNHIGYCKSNCRWVTQEEQQRNRTNNVLYKGKTLSERRVILNLSKGVFDYRRYTLKLSIKDSLGI